ncbi:MAG TPA: efflux RND transporter periplasmic adaptor subunit [Thiobacillaceae bacterium]|nr:efflux RND transporter periplasmic adaptor subunit [Thiobacillaceae bacterium]
MRTALSALLLTLFLSGCGEGEQKPAGPSGGGMPPPHVSVVQVQPQLVSLTLEYTGQTAGYRDAEVRARVSGILLKRLYQEGSLVRAGQPMFQIDPAPFKAALDQAEAARAVAEARLAQSQADLLRLRKDATRLKPLFEGKAVSQKEYDDAVSGEQAAQAAVQAAQAEIQAARARIASARLDLGYTQVEAPISGLTGRALKSEGSLLSAGDATLLTTVTQIEPLYVLFGIPDGEQLKLERAAAAGRVSLPKDGRYRVRVKLADGSVLAQAGRMTFSDNRVNAQTGTVEGRAELPNPGGKLLPGQFVRVLLDGAERPAAMLVPQRAVMEGPQGKFVYVVNGKSTAEPRPVKVGDWVGEQWVIEEGLQPGDRVIVDGALKVMPGAPVQVAPPASGPDAAQPKPGR